MTQLMSAMFLFYVSMFLLNYKNMNFYVVCFLLRLKHVFLCFFFSAKICFYNYGDNEAMMYF